VTLSVRGITRRKKEICAFPPLRVEFPQKPGPDSIFKGQKRLKLVTHCQRDYQQYLLLEYTAYRLYRALTPESFNVRLARLTIPIRTAKPSSHGSAFLLRMSMTR